VVWEGRSRETPPYPDSGNVGGTGDLSAQAVPRNTTHLQRDENLKTAGSFPGIGRDVTAQIANTKRFR
jgi:hypothetical protein